MSIHSHSLPLWILEMASIYSAFYQLTNLPLVFRAKEEELQYIGRISTINEIKANIRQMTRHKQLWQLLLEHSPESSLSKLISSPSSNSRSASPVRSLLLRVCSRAALLTLSCSKIVETNYLRGHTTFNNFGLAC